MVKCDHIKMTKKLKIDGDNEKDDDDDDDDELLNY